jgi:hypothetical protein
MLRGNLDSSGLRSLRSRDPFWVTALSKNSAIAGLLARHLGVGLVIPGLGVTRAQNPCHPPLADDEGICY